MPEKDYEIVRNGKSQSYTAEDFNSPEIQNWLGENTDVETYEVSAYNPTDKTLDGDFFRIKSPKGKSEDYTREDIESLEMQEWIKQNPNYTVSRVRPIGSYGDNLRHEYATGENLKGVFDRMSEIDEEIKAMDAQKKSGEVSAADLRNMDDAELAQAAAQAISQPAKKRRELNKEMEKLRAERDNNPVYKRYMEHENSSIDQSAEHLRHLEDALLLDNPKSARIQGSRLMSDRTGLSESELAQDIKENPDFYRDLEAFHAAKTFYDDAKKIASAPSKYGKESGIANYWAGIKDTGWEALSVVSLAKSLNNIPLMKAVEKIQENEGDDVNIHDFVSGDMGGKEYLSEAQKELMKAFVKKVEMEGLRSDNLSRGYQAGKSAAQSAGFMLDFLLFGGAGELAADAFVKGAVEKTAEGTLARIGAESLYGLVKATAMTPLMPSSYASILNNIAQLDEAGKMDLSGNAVLKAVGDALIENVSETIGSKPLEVLGWAGGKVIPTDWISKTSFGGWANAMRHSPWFNAVKQTGYNGFVEEMFEEVSGGALRWVTGVDKDALKEFLKPEQLLITAASFAPMTLIGGVPSTVGFAKASRNVKDREAELRKILESANINDDSINELFNLKYNAENPEDLGQQMADVYRGVVKNGVPEAQAIKAFQDYAFAVSKYRVMEGAFENQNAEERSQQSMQISAQVGGQSWYHQGEGGKNYVRTITDPNGEVMYVVGEDEDSISAIDSQTGEHRFVDKKGITDGVYTDSGEITVDKYLDDARKQQTKAADQQRVSAEASQALATLNSNIANNVPVPMGTEEQPVEGVIVKNEDGTAARDEQGNLIVETPDGRTPISPDDLATRWGLNLHPKSQEELDNEAVEVEVEAQKRKRAYNTIQPGTPLKANLEGLDEPVDVTFVRAVYDENDQSIRIKAIDVETGKEIDLPESAFPDLAKAAAQMSLDEEANTGSVDVEPEDNAERDMQGEALPLKADGSVDQKTLWDEKPEAWAAWNDKQNGGNPADTLEYVGAAISQLESDINELNAAKAKELDFDKRNAIKEAIAKKTERLNRLNGIVEGYTRRAEEAEKAAEQQNDMEGYGPVVRKIETKKGTAEVRTKVTEKDGIRTTKVVTIRNGEEITSAQAVPLPEGYKIKKGQEFSEDSEVLGITELRESKDGRAAATFLVKLPNGSVAQLNAPLEIVPTEAASQEQLTPEQHAAAAEEQRRVPLRAKAQEWAEKIGVPVVLMETPEDVQDQEAREAIAEGQRVTGWYDPNTGKVYIYVPNIRNEAEIDKTYIHEVISHKGLKDMLGVGFNTLLDHVWNDIMTDEKRKFFTDYVKKTNPNASGQALQRAAADEFIADLSERIGLETVSEEDLSNWDKFVKMIREFFMQMIAGGVKITEEDLSDLLVASMARYKEIKEKGSAATLLRREQAIENGVASEVDAASIDEPAIRFNIRTEESVEEKIRDFAKTDEAKKLGWTQVQVEDIISETSDLMKAINAAVSGDKYYDEWKEKNPTTKVDWRDGVEKPVVTWSRANIEYKYDMSADLLCINNEGLETVLSHPTMVDLMLKMNESTKEGFTSDDYLRLYETLRDLGFVVPCKGCFDAAMRLKMLPSVSRKFVDLVNKTIDERNKDPKAFDDALRASAGEDATIAGFPTSSKNKDEAVRVGVAGDNLTEHISWAQLMSAEGQTKALSDWGGIFRAWQRTGAGRPKDKLLPEPWSGEIVSTETTIIGKYGEKTPSYRDINVNQGTGLRRNSHSEFRPILAIDEIQFMREAYLRGLTVFKYMKELDDVRLFGKLGVKFNMSFFPAFVEGCTAAGLDANGDYIAAEESVGGREFEYTGEDGKTHYDGMRGWQEAQKYVNKDVSLSSVIFSIPHLIKAFTDVPTRNKPRGLWGSLIPFHASGSTSNSLEKQGLGKARAIGGAHGFDEAMSDWDKGVTNFEAVQNDRFGEGWEVVDGKRAGTAVEPGHKLEFANGTHYYNKSLGLHLFSSFYIYDSEIKKSMLDKKDNLLATKAKAAGHPFVVDYNDKVREIGTDTAYQDAADYYIQTLRDLGLIPRFDFEVDEETYLKACEAARVDPNDPILGWRGPGNSWSPADSEAYYSLWCDYGMIDPETGVLAPHNPVGIIDEQGNRTFEMPENTIDIVKAGVARYSERKSREEARVGEAINEFANRSVEAGKISREDADAVLSGESAEEQPEKTGDQILGEILDGIGRKSAEAEHARLRMALEDSLTNDGYSYGDQAVLDGYGLEAADLRRRDDVVTLQRIIAKEKGQGAGTRFMNDLTEMADKNGWTLALTPSADFGASSIERLKDFYKRFGFKENKGRYTDFTVNESMLRQPNGDNGIRFAIRGLNGALAANDYEVDENYLVAEEMEKAGKDPVTIWRATGWEKGADGKWRNEIPDAKQKEGTSLEEYSTAQDVVDAPELFKSYPDLQFTTIQLVDSDSAGAYNGKDNRITIDRKYNTKQEDGRTVLTKEGTRTLVHEFQHAIQQIEGFAKGGSTKTMEHAHYLDVAKDDLPLATFAFNLSRRNSQARLIRAGREEVIRQAENLDKSRFNEKDKNAFAELIDRLKNITDKEYASMVRKAAKVVKDAKASGESGYRRLAGEVEARNVEARSQLSEEGRRNNPPSTTEDTSRKQQIIRFRVSNEDQRIFISNAEKAVTDLKMDKATPEQWKKTLEKNGGLKAAEDKWLGLSTWLDGLDRKTVTKQEVLDYIAENQIQIEEQRYSEEAEESYARAISSYQKEYLQLVDEGEEAGEYNAFEYAYDQMIERYGDDFGMAFYRDGNTITPAYDYEDDLTDAARYFLDQRREETDVRGINATRLDYTTEGLRNRQEIALTVPTIESWNEGDKIHFGDAGEGRAIAWARFGDTWTSKAKDEAKKAYYDAFKAYTDYKKEITAKYALQATDTKKVKDLATEEENAKVRELYLESQQKYHDWQFGQHPREKVLVIDEIQSKRHQEAREQGGYKDDSALKKAQARLDAAKKAVEDYAAERYKQYGEENTLGWTREEKEEYNRLYREYRDAQNIVTRNGFDPMEDEEYRRLKAEQEEYENSAEFRGAIDEWKERSKSQDIVERARADRRLDPFQKRNFELIQKMQRRENELAEEFNATHKSKIPAAPFEKNWHELTMKRMLRYAAENGYDTVAWTTGDQQAERYNMESAIGKLYASRDGEKYYVEVYDPQGNEITFNGLIGDSRSTGSYTQEELVNIFGKEGAKEIITAVDALPSEEEAETLRKKAEETRTKEDRDAWRDARQATIDGSELFKGEGMKGFYDDILPRFMNKYGKKWGVKVEDIELPMLGEDAAAGAQKGLTMHSVPVTEEMKESVMSGQLMFRRAMDEEYQAAVEAGDMDAAQEMVDQAAEAAGYTIRGYHGTTHNFTIFDQSKGNAEGNWGKGFYFTNNLDDAEANYGNEDGPDLQVKIERLAENMEWMDGYEDMDFEERKAKAAEMLTGDDPHVISAAIRMSNPVVFNSRAVGPKETFFDFDSGYNPETDEYEGEESGLLLDFIEAWNDVMMEPEWDSNNISPNEILDYADGDGITASQLEEKAREILDNNGIMDYNGDLASGEFLRQVFERMGFDGIVDANVNIKFGTQRRYGRSMDGMDYGTTHFVAFQPEQIKQSDPVTRDDDGNIIPISKRFDESNPDIRFRITPEQDADYMEAVNAGDMDKAQQMVKDAAKAAGYNSPKLYHGSDAFGFTRIDTSMSDDRASFWATNKENVAGSYTKLSVTRKPGSEISEEEYEKAVEVADNALDEEIQNFRSLIDKYFSEWFFGDGGNDGIRHEIMGANHIPGYGDGVYDVLEDYVAEAFRDYGEDHEEEYEDFADWEENSPEAQEIFDSISSLEGLRNQLWEIENGDLTGGIYELYANTDNMFVVDAGGNAWNNLHPEGLPKIERDQYKNVPYRTRDVVKWAKENGYDGVIFKNIRDNGRYGRTEPSDVYAFLNPQSQVKSADPVTYDDQGNVIPLSERFNEGNDDIRFRIAPMNEAEAEEAAIRFRTVQDPLKVAELEAGEKIPGYRTVVLNPDGSMASPMAGELGVAKAKKSEDRRVKTSSFTENTWNEAEENPDLADENGKIKLIKTDNAKRGLVDVDEVDYNPYNHLRLSPVNLQFKDAWKRPDLIYIKSEVPKSEAVDLRGIKDPAEKDRLSPYHAEKAVLPVGIHDWSGGGELLLSRWDKPVGQVAWEEIADAWANDEKVKEGVQFDRVPPQILDMLVERGIEILPPSKGKDKNEAYKAWKAGDQEAYEAWRDTGKAPKKGKNGGGNIRFRVANENQEVFVSNAAAALDKIKMEKATPEQWTKMLEKEGGLKAGEDKWLGLSDWLKGLDRKTVTKQEVSDFIEENKIRIEEVHYSERGTMLEEELDDINNYGLPPALDDFHTKLQHEFDDLLEEMSAEEAYETMAEKYGEKFREAYDEDEVVDGESLDWTYIDALMELAGLKNEGEANDDRAINATRLTYTTYGLDNKREIALTVPTIEPWNIGDDIHFGDAGEGRAIAWIRFGDTYTKKLAGMLQGRIEYVGPKAKDSATRRAIQGVLMNWNDSDSVMRNTKPEDQFWAAKSMFENSLNDNMSSYAPEQQKAAKEILAALETLKEEDFAPIRNEGDKVLVIDEIQSKRHQEGREKGYMGDQDVTVKYDEENKGWNYYFKGEHRGYMNELIAPTEEEALRLAKSYYKKGVPVAPFEKNWHELAMKRMLRLAAEEGYGYIAWTTGDQQAERYDLGSAVSKIISRPESHPVTGEDEFFVDIYGNGRSPLYSLIVSKEGVVEAEEPEFDGKNLSDIVGKELAVKILSAEDGTVLEGENLRIGAEGMKGFYDDILPRFMNKYGKKWGVKVEDKFLPEIGMGSGLTMHTVPVTQEMKDSVMEGQTMFRITPEQDKEYMDAVNAGDMEKAQQMVNEAAERAMPESKVRGEDGKLKVVYHGTGVDFTVFKRPDLPYYNGMGNGFYFTDSKKAAELYSNPFFQDNQDKLHDEMQRILVQEYGVDVDDAYEQAYNYAEGEHVDEAIDKAVNKLFPNRRVISAFLNIERPFYPNERPREYAQDAFERGEIDGVIDKNFSEDYGSIIFEKVEESKRPEGKFSQYVAFKSAQIKSAEPVTYDDNGNVIPLSQRFNESNPDIRFRVTDGMSADDLVKRVQGYGLRGILDEDAAKAFWADAYAVMPEDARRQIVDQAFSSDADKQELNIRRYTRQYIADLAKKGYAEDESGLLRYLADKIKAELGQDLDENTLRYLIWRSANRYNTGIIINVAEDIAMRRRLGVGEFNGQKFPAETTEAMNEAEESIESAEDEREETRQVTRHSVRKTPYAALNKAMSGQRKYDQETVASLVKLAKSLMKNIDGLTKREMSLLLTDIKDANGRRPAKVKEASQKLLDLMVKHTIGKEKEQLENLVKVRTEKVRDPGVGTMAKLDLRAQNIINYFRDNYQLSEAEIDKLITELEDKMADGRRTDASLEDMRSQLEGLQLAKQYAADIAALENDIKAIRQQMKDAKDEFDELSAEEKKQFRTALNEELAAGEEMIRAKKIQQVDAYRRLRGDIAKAIDEGAERAKTFLEAERERVEQIHHWANSDMQGVSADVRDRKLTGWAKFANSSFAKLFTAPLANLDQMLRTLGRKSPEGRGYLWNWMMGEVRNASDTEKLGIDAAEKKLNDKVSEIFDEPGMEWNDLYSMERKMPKAKMRYFSANGEWVEEELTQGNLLYIYMVNKMTDGRMKLRQMNITDENVEDIKKALDPRFVELADWIQEEFLPSLRDRYNETHKRLFGTSMASIENYFPLRILGGVIEEKRNVGDQEQKTLPTDITGAIIKRTVNAKQLNLAGTDAFSLVVEHVREMEHWNAYAEASRDFSTLLKYKRFQNQLKQLNTIYGAGKDLMNLFWDTVNLSVGAFRPTTTPTDKAFLNLAKGVTAAKISFRAYTAIKQILSWPAFLADTNPLILGKNTLPINWKKNWDWAMENLPNFKKRVESRKAGLDILEDTSLDSKFWGTDFAKWINQNGMFMNAFVDALTVSIGARSVYETRKARYLKEGFSEEEADKKAKMDAEVAYNETQQSSEKEFMSTMQAHRTVANVALSAYRNSSMGYQRQLHQALRTLGRMMRKGYKSEAIEYMTKQLEREGLSTEDAEKAAINRYERAGWQAIVRVAVFGWLVQFAWNLGAHAIYLLFGDDPDEKKNMLVEDATHALIGGPIEGLAAGNIMSEAFNMIKNGENLRNWDPTTLPIMSDIKSTISKMSSDPVAGANDLVYLAAQIGLGTNPQTISDAIVAIVDACNGDFETAREVMFCIMRILAVPQSQLDQLMIDEIGMSAKDARELSYEDIAKRYVDYKMSRNAPVTGPLYSDELREKREKSLNTTFKKKVNERKKLKEEE